MSGAPAARPVGVRAVTAHGEVPLDDTLTYVGVDGDGLHVWTVSVSAHLRVREIRADEIPGRTKLKARIRVDTITEVM